VANGALRVFSLTYLRVACSSVQEYWTVNNPLQNTIISLLEQIVGALGTDFKLYLPHIVPHILRVFLHDTTPGRTTIAKVSHYMGSALVWKPWVYRHCRCGIGFTVVW